MMFTVVVETPYGDDGERSFEIEATDELQAGMYAIQFIHVGVEKIISIEDNDV